MDDLYEDYDVACPSCGDDQGDCDCSPAEIRMALAQIEFDAAVAELEAENSDDYGDRDWNEHDGIDINKRFADPGGNSALYPATTHNPRVHPCPNCGAPNRLTRMDKLRGYQCDRCANALEQGF